MLCIFCCQERAPSCEHVLPLAIGGTITTDRVCEECNSTLGSRVDAALSGTGIAVCVRVFDIYATGIVVSRDPSRYLSNGADQAKLRFLAIDAVSGHTVDTPFVEESRRLATAMTAYGRPPPFLDPLTPVTDQVPLNVEVERD